MKLSKLREIIAKTEENYNKYAECVRASKENPEDAALKRRCALAAAHKNRSIQTLSNYMPIFTVTLGEFAQTAKEAYDKAGVECNFTCCNFTEKENGKIAANVVISLSKNGKSKDYDLCKVELENENQPLAQVQLNLLAKMFIKGMQDTSRDSRINSDFDVIAWDTVCKKYIKIREENRIAKAIREEERTAKRKAKEEEANAI